MAFIPPTRLNLVCRVVETNLVTTDRFTETKTENNQDGDSEREKKRMLSGFDNKFLANGLICSRRTCN
jgi:hypothetical protein